MLRDRDSLVVVDLGAVEVIGALVLQADHDDSYAVTCSDQPFSSAPAWSVEPVYAGPSYPRMGLRTRSAVLPTPCRARYLIVEARRDRTSGDGFFSVARLQAFSSRPAPWPPDLDRRGPRSFAPPFPRLDIGAEMLLKGLLGAVAAVLAVWCARSGRAGPGGTCRGIGRLSLAALTLASLFAWPHFLNFHLSHRYQVHDVYHYYIGAKYTAELGYTRLYECTALADAEEGIPEAARPRAMTDLASDRAGSTAAVLARPERCRRHFGPQRWEKFKRDLRWFREEYPGFAEWSNVILDHGFNGSPAWMVVGTPLANLVPPSELNITLLASIDMLLLLGTAALLYATFGFEAAAFSVTFFCLNGIAPYQWTGSAFLRYIWFASLALGICALRAGRHGLAGAALTYAALLRIFPGVVLAGIAFRALIQAVVSRSLEPLRATKRLAAGSAVAFVVLVGLSLPVSGRSTVWGEFIQNSRKHFDEPAANDIGLEHLLREGITKAPAASPGAAEGPDAPSLTVNTRATAGGVLPARFVAVAVFLLLLGYAFRREPLWVSAVLSLGLAPFLLTLSNYYYALLAFYGLLWPRRPAVVVLLAVLGCVAWLPVRHYGVDNMLPTGLLLTAAILLFVVTATALVAAERPPPRPD